MRGTLHCFQPRQWDATVMVLSTEPDEWGQQVFTGVEIERFTPSELIELVFARLESMIVTLECGI